MTKELELLKKLQLVDEDAKASKSTNNKKLSKLEIKNNFLNNISNTNDLEKLKDIYIELIDSDLDPINQRDVLNKLESKLKKEDKDAYKEFIKDRQNIKNPIISKSEKDGKEALDKNKRDSKPVKKKVVKKVVKKADKPKVAKQKTDKSKTDKPKVVKKVVKKVDKSEVDKPKVDKSEDDKPKADKPKVDKQKTDKPKKKVVKKVVVVSKEKDSGKKEKDSNKDIKKEDIDIDKSGDTESKKSENNIKEKVSYEEIRSLVSSDMDLKSLKERKSNIEKGVYDLNTKETEDILLFLNNKISNIEMLQKNIAKKKEESNLNKSKSKVSGSKKSKEESELKVDEDKSKEEVDDKSKDDDLDVLDSILEIDDEDDDDDDDFLSELGIVIEDDKEKADVKTDKAEDDNEIKKKSPDSVSDKVDMDKKNALMNKVENLKKEKNEGKSIDSKEEDNSQKEKASGLFSKLDESKKRGPKKPGKENKGSVDLNNKDSDLLEDILDGNIEGGSRKDSTDEDLFDVLGIGSDKVDSPGNTDDSLEKGKSILLGGDSPKDISIRDLKRKEEEEARRLASIAKRRAMEEIQKDKADSSIFGKLLGGKKDEDVADSGPAPVGRKVPAGRKMPSTIPSKEERRKSQNVLTDDDVMQRSLSHIVLEGHDDEDYDGYYESVLPLDHDINRSNKTAVKLVAILAAIIGFLGLLVYLFIKYVLL